MSLFRSYLGDKTGNMSMYLGIAILTLFMGIGCAFDISQVSAHKTRLNDLADTTALAAAIVARDGDSERMQVAQDYFDANKDMSGPIEVDTNPSIVFNDTVKEVTVAVTAEVEYAMMGMFGFSNPTVTASSTVNYMIDDVAPLSIAFAFDTSGSMDQTIGSDGPKKIDALKASTHDLFEAMMDEAERPDLLEASMSTTFSSFNDALVNSELMAEGYDHVTAEVDAMVPGGWTYFSPSLQFTLDELNAAKASETDNRWKGYVVFMTDGKNDSDDDSVEAAWNIESLALCDQLKSSGYEVYTVAFAAEPEGEALLQQCASSAEHYYDSANADQLKQAFVLIGRKLGESTVRLKS